MKIEVQDTTWKRMRGAMFRDSLNDCILVFPYAHPDRRVFHTFFCPPIRIIGLDAAGTVCFCRDVSPNRFVRLPEAQFVLETDLTVPAEQAADRFRAQHPDPSRLVPQRASYFDVKSVRKNLEETDLDVELPDDFLRRALVIWIFTALKELRSLSEMVENSGRSLRDVLWSLEPAERAKKLSFALDVIDFSRVADALIADGWAPWGDDAGIARRLADKVPAAIHEQGDMYEVSATDTAGLPWPQRRKPSAICIRCQKSRCTWSRVLKPERTVPDEACWRYDRPENCVPLCYACSRTIKWPDNRQLRIEVARIVWGPRFEAFLRWHEAATENALPDSWDKSEYLLWPPSYGGDTWETGSGARKHVDIYSPNDIPRTSAQRDALAAYLKVSPDELPRPLVSFPEHLAGAWESRSGDA